MPRADVVDKPAEIEEAQPPDPADGKTFATRETFLAAAGHLSEEEIQVEGLGWLLLSEISGADRADIVAKSMMAYQRNELDVKGYQRAVLLAGIVDPSSPQDERAPMFRSADMDQVMKVGGSKLLEAIDVIERLSLMGKYQPGAEGNLLPTPSSERTSG